MEYSLIQDLIFWSSQNNGYLDSNVEIYIDKVTGLSFRATKDMLPGVKFVNCSSQMTLSYLNAIESGFQFNCHDSVPFSPRISETLETESPHIIGNYFLMQQYLMGRLSFWWDYIKLLPQPGQFKRLCLPVWWPDSDLKFLEGTNAQSSVDTIKKKWHCDWQIGNRLVEEFTNASEFTCELYKWAATIFSTRSFRASLTIHQNWLSIGSLHPGQNHLISNHISRDNFSVLLPLLDIGNHNGINQVQLGINDAFSEITLENSNIIKQGAQIYNYYGEKTNSELLVGYGFILSSKEQDTVNLKLSPTSSALELHQKQSCHSRYNRKRPEEENIFQVRYAFSSSKEAGIDQDEFALSPGLIDLLTCMIATEREKLLLLKNPDCCLEHNSNRFMKKLGRNAIQTWQLICDKLLFDVAKLQTSENIPGAPENPNQELALGFRSRQLDVLYTAYKQISSRLSRISQCSNPNNSTMKQAQSVGINPNVMLVSLECAYEWLRIYPSIYNQIMKLISEDQEEPLPLDWTVLLKDWDQTYWVVWICLIYLLQKVGKLNETHLCLSAWLENMKTSYYIFAEMGHNLNEEEYLDSAEREIVNGMISAMLNEVDQSLCTKDLDEAKKLAVFIVRNEMIVMQFMINRGLLTGKMIHQKILCVSNS